MLPGDTSYHQLRYQYIKILNKIRKQNQIGAGASEAQPGDAKSGMAWHGSGPSWSLSRSKFSFGHHGSHVDADHFFFDPWSQLLRLVKCINHSNFGVSPMRLDP